MMFTKTRHFDPSFVNTIEKDTIYHGNWWLPSSPADRVSGVLYLHKSGGIKLHLIGMFQNDSSETLGHTFADHEIVYGEIVPGNGSVTLVDCKERQRESPYLSNTTIGAVQRFKINYLIFGYHLNQLKFSSFEFSTTYLVDWMNSKLLNLEFKGGQAVVSTLPKKQIATTGNGYTVTMSSWVSTSLGGSYSSTPESSITIDLSEPIALEKFIERFQKPFLDLLQFGSSYLNSLTFLNATPVGFEKSLKLIPTNEFDQITHATGPVNQNALFLLSDLEGTWQNFVLKWLTLHQSTQHIFRLYFDSMHINFQFPVTKFLNIIQSIESYHAEREKNDDVKLRIRLQELLSETDNLLSPIIRNSENFISRSIDTRNYYTHYNAKKKKKAAEGLELSALTHTLGILLNYHLLIACHVDKDKCTELINRNDIFRSIEQLVDEKKFWN